MILGVTGHQRLADESAWPWVEQTLRSVLAEAPRPMVGLSSLAIGVDQLFAELVMEQGGALQVVLPFATYEGTFFPGSDRDRYRALLARAAAVETLPAQATPEKSYLAAGQRLVDRAERLIAVWDGKEAAGLGGTGDVVRYARDIGKEILYLDPVLRKVI